jgi:hypothetical protein
VIANWSYPTAIRFGAGRIAELPEACVIAGIGKPLLVTDRGLADLPVTQTTLDFPRLIPTRTRIIWHEGSRPISVAATMGLLHSAEDRVSTWVS